MLKEEIVCLAGTCEPVPSCQTNTISSFSKQDVDEESTLEGILVKERITSVCLAPELVQKASPNSKCSRKE